MFIRIHGLKPDPCVYLREKSILESRRDQRRFFDSEDLDRNVTRNMHNEVLFKKNGTKNIRGIRYNV